MCVGRRRPRVGAPGGAWRPGDRGESSARRGHLPQTRPVRCAIRGSGPARGGSAERRAVGHGLASGRRLRSGRSRCRTRSARWRSRRSRQDRRARVAGSAVQGHRSGRRFPQRRGSGGGDRRRDVSRRACRGGAGPRSAARPGTRHAAVDRRHGDAVSARRCDRAIRRRTRRDGGGRGCPGEGVPSDADSARSHPRAVTRAGLACRSKQRGRDQARTGKSRQWQCLPEADWRAVSSRRRPPRDPADAGSPRGGRRHAPLSQRGHPRCGRGQVPADNRPVSS